MKSKYLLMNPSTTVFDDRGNPFPDLATFPIENFTPNSKSNTYMLTEQDVYRFDILTDINYGNFDFYDDFTLWINDIEFITDDANIGRNISLFSKADIDTFYNKNIK